MPGKTLAQTYVHIRVRACLRNKVLFVKQKKNTCEDEYFLKMKYNKINFNFLCQKEAIFLFQCLPAYGTNKRLRSSQKTFPTPNKIPVDRENKIRLSY